MQMGCEGLNLQEMNEVYFVSPFWNPAMEEQAIGRCYRLGKTNQHMYSSLNEFCLLFKKYYYG